MQVFTISPQKLSELIGIVYDSALEDLQWQSLLDELIAMFPFTTISVIGFNGETTSVPYAVAGDKPPDYPEIEAALQIELTQMIANNPHVLDLPLGYISHSKETWRGAFHESSFYQNVVKPMGFDHYFSLKFIGAKDRYAMIAVGLKDELEPQNKIVHDVLTLLSPHIVRAAQLNRTLKLARSATEALTGFLDAIVLPMLVVNANCDLLFSNSAGRRLLDRESLFRTTPQGQLVLNDADNTHALSQQIRGMEKDVCPSGLRVANMGTWVSLCMTPFKPTMIDATRMDRDMIERNRMFAIFVGQHHDDSINTGLLQDIFKLTQRESEICSDLMSARSVPQIAEASGRSEKTIRNQIQMIYEKVEVGSYAELIDAMSVFRIAGSLFDDPGLHPERLVSGS